MRNLLLISMLLASFISCKKKYKQLTITDQALRDAMNIQVGSQFVYQDSITGEIDTYIVVRYDHTVDDIKNDDRKEMYETIAVNAKSKKLHSIYIVLGRNSYHMNRIFFNSRIFGSSNGSWFPTHNGTVYSIPLKSDEFLRAFYKGHYDSISLGSIIFKDVYNFENDNVAGKMHSYFSPQSGVVQFSTEDTLQGKRVWTLISSNIIRK